MTLDRENLHGNEDVDPDGNCDVQPMPQIGGKPADGKRVDEPLLHVSIFNNETDKWPSPRELTWTDLKAKYFSRHAQLKVKRPFMVFSPVAYEPGSSRNAKNVVAVYCAVFDIEHHGPFAVIKDKLRGYAFAAYSSFSHSEADPRYRLILPLAQPVPGADWSMVWERLNAWVGGINDPSTKDACRIYYLPSRPLGSTDYFIEEGEGEPLNVEMLPPIPVERVAKLHAASSANVGKNGCEASQRDVRVPANLSPEEGLLSMVGQCSFMQSVSEPIQQPNVGRPQWMAMVSNASMFEDSEEWIHAASSHHDQYDEVETDKMIDSCRKFGAPITCGKIRESGFGGCPAGGCKTVSGKITNAPAGLAAIAGKINDLKPEFGMSAIDIDEYRLESTPYRVSDKGVFFEKTKDGEVFPVRISSRIDVLAQTVDDAGTWGFLLSVTDPNGVAKQWAMPRDLLASSSAWRSVLLSMGADIYPAGKEDHLYEYIMAANPSARARSVAKPGWTHDAKGAQLFVLPGQAIGNSSERVVFQAKDVEAQSTFGQSGGLDRWKSEVADLCVGNSRLMIALCAALAGPLLHVLGEENGGFHLVGPSSIGKTTAVNVAASVWGRCDLFVKSWRTTDNALESTAVRHNDTLLILDELSQVDSQKAGEIAYMLGNGKGKGRADKYGAPRASSTWRVLFLSTGERSLAEHMESGNRQALAGQEVRLINVAADANAGFGLFEDLRGSETAQEFAALIKRSTMQYYGIAGPSFIESLINCENLKEVIVEVRERMDKFVSLYVPASASGQVKRVARRFGLLAAAGELAVQLQVVPWEEGEATRGILKCLQSWLDSLGSLGNQESDQAVSQVRRFIELHGESRFTSWDETDMSQSQRPTINRAGYRRLNDQGQTEYYVFPEVYKTDVCRGLRVQQVTRALRDADLLVLPNDGRNLRTERLPDGTSKKVYRIKAAILGDGDEAVT